MKIIIPGELPDLNEIIRVSKLHYGAYSTMKRKYTKIVAIHSMNLPKIKKGDFVIRWYSKNRRKDPDNIAGGGTKILLDGLIDAGILENDGWNQVNSITHLFEVDKNNPRTEVVIYESK